MNRPLNRHGSWMGSYRRKDGEKMSTLRRKLLEHKRLIAGVVAAALALVMILSAAIPFLR